MESGQCSNDAPEDDKSHIQNDDSNSDIELPEKTLEVKCNENPLKYRCEVCKVSFQTYYKFCLHNKNFLKYHKLHGNGNYTTIRKRGRRKKGKALYYTMKNKNKTLKRGRKCDFSFNSEIDHDYIGDIPLTKEIIAEKKYSTKQIFKSHTANENGGYTCKICDKTISQKWSFIDHLRRYTGDYAAFCEICNRGFNRVQPYRNHMVKHAAIKSDINPTSSVQAAKMENFTCDKCGRTFKWVGLSLFGIVKLGFILITPSFFSSEIGLLKTLRKK